MLLSSGIARADNCSDATTLVRNGVAGASASQSTNELAAKVCANIMNGNNPDPAMVTMCNQIGDLGANTRLQDANVQQALDKFEKSFSIPKDEFLRALQGGKLRELMSGHGIPDNVLDAALAQESAKESLAAAGAKADANLSTLTNSGGAGSTKLRDKLANTMRTPAASATPSGSADKSLDGLTPSHLDVPAADKEPDSLTLFEIVHLKYVSLTPRMKPGNRLAPEP